MPKIYIIILLFISAFTGDGVIALAGSTAKITCKYPTKASEFAIAWSLNGETITVYHSVDDWTKNERLRKPSANQFGTETYLEIPNVVYKDAGIYQCTRFTTKITLPSQSKNVILNVQGKI